MNQMGTRKTAILVDGGYYRKRAYELWGSKPPAERASEIVEYCMLHIEKPQEPRDLYRIFYYDCPPLRRVMKHPLTQNEKDYSAELGTKWAEKLYEHLANKRKVALRMGELAESQAKYILKPDVLPKLLNQEIEIADLTERDFKVDVKQKGVDMRIGLDAASLAYGRYVDQIILIAGDSDFVPVAKMARRNGIDFVLDPMGQYMRRSLQEHIDGIETFTDCMYAAE